VKSQKTAAHTLFLDSRFIVVVLFVTLALLVGSVVITLIRKKWTKWSDPTPRPLPVALRRQLEDVTDFSATELDLWHIGIWCNHFVISSAALVAY
jgi:hypothetical protein